MNLVKKTVLIVYNTYNNNSTGLLDIQCDVIFFHHDFFKV